MPIRRECRDLYPADWPEISARIRYRAGFRCETCGVRDGAIGGRTPRGTFVEANPIDCSGRRPIVGNLGRCGRHYLRIIRIVLTVAHLNHDPRDCRDENLKALCQRCHNRYDQPYRLAGIRARRRAAMHTMELAI